MSLIHVLSDEVVGQIAAGEVVERPAHLVKELLENSLDAKATKIEIETHSGGRTIVVADNGSGIKKEDLFLALKRHATSKINTTDDLWALNTFGFRGEALASAAAVAKISIVSRYQQAKQSFQLQSEFAKAGEIVPASRSQGTEIKIENLFENVPARLKFLKSDASENAQIKNVIKAMALSNPTVEFKYVESGKLEMFYAAREKMLDRAQDVLGVKKLYEHWAQRESYQATAYFASPQEVAKTSKNIWIFAQSRWIQDRGLQAAVMEAYRSLLMHGEYPQVVIHLNCDPAEIDVNISPTKSQVKFQNQSLAFRAVQASVRDGLEQAPWLEKKWTDSIKIGTTQTGTTQTNTHSNLSESVQKHRYHVPEAKPLSFYDSALSRTQYQQKSYSVFTEKNLDGENPSIEDLKKLRIENVSQQDSSQQLNSNRASFSDQRINPSLHWSSLQVIGQSNLTYIVCQRNDKMLLVDQHAAHERVVFEKLMQKWRGGNIDLQNYLFPLAIDLSPEKCEALLLQKNEIEKMGVEIEQMGPGTIGVKSAPSLINESSLPRVLEKMAHDSIEYGGSYSLEKSIGDILATMACHSVIRAGQSLSQQEMRELLISMDEYPLSSFCPHGRPVSIELSFTEIEKMFGRIT